MEVIRVVPSGYCKGVVNAISIARKTKDEHPNEKVYVLGMIVHNSHVTKELENYGIITLDDTHRSKSELLDEIDEGVVIFTAHGISDQIREKAIRKGLTAVDASCVDVLKTRQAIISKLDEGYDVIYFGKKNHPEAEAIISISERIHLVTSGNDIAQLELHNSRLFFTNQTTMSMLELKELISELKEKFPTLEVKEEICNATSSRQQAILNLEDCEMLYVVGDTKSNNTTRLRDIALKHGIKEVHLIQDSSEIKKDDLKGHHKVHVTAGASTPPSLIREVIDFLSSSDLGDQ